MIRSVRLTDLVALISFNNRAFLNEAKAIPALGQGVGRPLPLGAFLKEWLSLEENRHTWISTQQQQIQGLLSTRNRGGQRVWEVDRLLLSPRADIEEVCLALFDYLSAVGGEVGVEKVFLRLGAESPLLEVARQAGFTHYTTETLYSRESPSDIGGKLHPLEGLRSKSSSDEHALFQLYNLAVPTQVRRAEALTFQEWRETRERGWDARGRREFLIERKGRVAAWLQIALSGRIGYLDLLVHPEEGGQAGPLLELGLRCLRGRFPILSLVPDYYAGITGLLKEKGFSEVGQFYSFVKQLTVRVRLPSLMPVRV